MASQPKSKAVEEYRRQIAIYLETIRLGKGWKLVKMGEQAGGLKHTTISRAIKRENTLSYPALMALEVASGIPLPDSLKGAAIAAQQPAHSDAPTAADLRQVADELKAKSPEFQRALLEELKRSLEEAG